MRSPAAAWLLVVSTVAATAPALAADADGEPPSASATIAGEDDAPVTFLDHDHPGRFWFGGSINMIGQYHPSFAARYTGTNSLKPGGESALSGLLTGFFAYAPFRTTELILDPEMALGGGLSGAVGAGGFPNLDVVRNPTLSHAPYIARVELHQIIPLSDQWVVNQSRGPLSSLARLPRHRLEVRIGKMSTVDVFDINPAGSDSHLQFMNWTVDNNGAFDYAADTRGYTYGIVLEYAGPRVKVRAGELLLPKVANGLDLDFDVSRSRGENLELEVGYCARKDWGGTLRLLGYRNHAGMGSYREAIDAFVNGIDPRPDITLHRRPGRVKGGVAANLVQEVFGRGRLFARIGWSSGGNESFAYTEVENTVQVGGDLVGAGWSRPHDRTGLAFVSNGLSSLHAEYLRVGGLGFLLGDGNLTYGRETILEHYYTATLWRGLSVAEDVQLIKNPGYNADRGPVWVLSARVHAEL